MPDPKVTPDMPPQPPRDTDSDASDLEVMDEPLRIKVFEEDHEDAGKVQTLAQNIMRTITLNEIIREAIHEGLPAVRRKYEAMVAAAKKLN